MHSATEFVLQWFAWGHLPENLQKVSRPFAELAINMAEYLPPSPEVTIAIRKLLEAKDAAVRAELLRGKV